MKTTTLTPSKRKIINLDIADTYEDSKLYAKLSKEHPEGHVILNQQEKTDFEKWLDVWMYSILRILKKQSRKIVEFS